MERIAAVNKVRLSGRKKFARQIMNLDGVQRAIDRVTRNDVEGPARARLARHRDTGAHSIFTYRDRHTRVVVLEGPAPASVQFGHHNPETGRWVRGLYILPTGAKEE